MYIDEFPDDPIIDIFRDVSTKKNGIIEESFSENNASDDDDVRRHEEDIARRL